MADLLENESSRGIAEAGAAKLFRDQNTCESRFGHFEQAHANLEAALQLHESAGDDRAVAGALVGLAVNEMRLGRIVTSEALTQRARAVYERLGDPRGRMICENNLGFMRLRGGDPASARDYSLAALAESRRLRDPAQEATALGHLGAAERDCGDTRAAIEHLEGALSVRAGREESVDMLVDRLELALAYLKDGRLADATALANELVESPPGDTMTLTWPYYLPWVVGTIFRASEATAARATAFLQRAADELEAYASIMDPEVRSDFLSLPLNDAILSAAGRAKTH